MKNEKLMNEKASLLDKQSDLLQYGADSSSKYFSLQQEVSLQSIFDHIIVIVVIMAYRMKA
jgi:aryl carrier-like protein